MKKLLIFLSLIIFNLLSFAQEYRSDRVIVKYKNGLVSQTLSSQTIKDFRDLKIKVVKVPKGMSVSDAIKYYKSLDGVEYVEPDYIIKKTDTIPNDTYYSLQWGLKKIGMEKVWDTCKGSNVITVAVIDTGVDLNHEDLKDNLWVNSNEICSNGKDDDNNGYIDDCYGWNFANSNNNPQDDDGHGTHVAGVIGAVTNNNKGVAGVNWNVKIMPIKVLDSNGSGSISDYINGIYYAVKNGAKVINSSLGFPDNCYAVPEPQSIKDAISYANNNGVLLVAAAGNYGCNNDITPFYPASIKLPNVIAVGSSSKSDTLSDFSNYGVKSVHILAPGEDIYSTYLSNSYESLDGTSMATPFVSGAVALLMACRNDLNYLQIKEQLLSSGDIFSNLNDKVISSGRLNVYNALTQPLKPVRPTGLSLSQNGNGVTITWQDNSNIETGFVLERNDGTQWQTIANLGQNQTSFTDSGLQYNKSYTYRVKAIYNTEESIYSELISTSLLDSKTVLKVEKAQIESVSQYQPSNIPSGYETPYGAISFTASTQETSIKITLTFPSIPSGAKIYKLINNQWIDITNSVTLNGSTVIFYITDNGAYDNDPRVGYISDPITLAVPTTTSSSSSSVSSGGGGGCSSTKGNNVIYYIFALIIILLFKRRNIRRFFDL